MLHVVDRAVVHAFLKARSSIVTSWKKNKSHNNHLLNKDKSWLFHVKPVVIDVSKQKKIVP